METPTEKKVSMTCACGKCVNPDGTLKEKPYEKMNEEEKKVYCFGHLREGIISSLQSQSTDLTKEQLDKIADVLNNKGEKETPTEKKSVLTEADLVEIARILPPTTVSAIYKVEQKVLANYKKGLREKVEMIIRNDKTDYEYEGSGYSISDIMNREGKYPPTGQRWKTPREIAEELLKELGEK